MNNNDQYDITHYLPVIAKAAHKYSGYYSNDQQEANADFSLKIYEFILKRQAANAVVNNALVYTTCKNRAIDYLRNEMAYKRSCNRNNLDIDELSERIGIEQEIIDNEYLALIKERALSVASAEQRQLIELRLSNDGATYSEIASRLGVSVSTVTRRAKMLAKRYEKTYGNLGA